VSPSEWSWNPEALLAVVLAGGYMVALRSFPAPRWRIACFVGAAILLLGIWATPVDTMARHYLVLVHLWQNVVLAEWAPLLLLLGLPPALAAALARPRAVSALTQPFVALPVWIANYALWHVPALYDAALRHPHSLLVAEHGLYLLTGLAVWWPVVHHAPHHLSSQGRAAYVFAAFVFSAPLGLVLALVPEPIYDFYASAPDQVWGLSRIDDQQLGGITMASEQAIVFFALFAYWFARFLAEQDRDELESPDGLAGRGS
jgi:putative membrane protein